MRQETIIKTYLKFSELTDLQKKKVLDKMRDINVDGDYWHDSVTDEFKAKLSDLGYTNIKTQFSGFWSQGDGASFSAEKDGHEISMTGRYCHSSNMTCDDKALLTESQDLAKQYYRDLEKAYVYYTSDESIIETIEANDYEFDSETLQLA